MTVAELIEKLSGLNPSAEVRLEVDDFDGMTSRGALARVTYDDDGFVLLQDESLYEPQIARPAPFTLVADGREVVWREVREIVSPATGETILPGDPGPANVSIDIEAAYFPAGETRHLKLTGHDGRVIYATCKGEEVEPGVTRVVFPLPRFEEKSPR